MKIVHWIPLPAVNTYYDASWVRPSAIVRLMESTTRGKFEYTVVTLSCGLTIKTGVNAGTIKRWCRDGPD